MSDDAGHETVAPRRTPRGRPSVIAARVLVAWLSARLGTRALALTGIALAVFFAVVGGDDRVLLALIFGGPYLLSALLLWFGASRLARA